MTVEHVRLPDVGEGVAEAELVTWHVTVGDVVTPDTVIVEVLTDKATVEIYAPVAGVVTFVHGEPGDVVAVGADLIGIETGGDGPGPEPTSRPEPEPEPEAVAEPEPESVAEPEPGGVAEPQPEAVADVRVEPGPPAETESSTGRLGSTSASAAPAIRRRAVDLGIDLGRVAATGPNGRVTHADLDRHLVGAGRTDLIAGATQTPLIGLRRKIAARMTTALRIPHITYVEEIDVTQLEHLRRSLSSVDDDRPRLTLLPFVMQALAFAVAGQPHLNSTLDDASDPAVLTTYGSIDVGIATQTDRGLVVPVVREVQRLDVWQTATELARVTSAARSGTASAGELAGSTITITSLGALGGIATTPIINHPEVAIVGINKVQTRPMWIDGSVVPRKMMNVSASFDHRVVDGYDAAVFVQTIKSRLEEPAMLFIPPPSTR